MATGGDVDLNTIFKDSNGVVIQEADRLRLARQVLICLFIICLIIFIWYAIQPDNKALSSIFEVIKVGVLPLVTLIISFYFPNTK